MQDTIVYNNFSDKHTLSLQLRRNVFKPNLTTELCIQVAENILMGDESLLDLGCGCGAIGLTLAQCLKSNARIYGSDISKHAVELTRLNAKLLNLSVDARVGSGFSPWKDMKFDIIINDISGISEQVAPFTPWFSDDIPCRTGKDGCEVTNQIIVQAINHMNLGGQLLFPVISLSNSLAVLSIARELYQSVEKVKTKYWPLPANMIEVLPLLRSLKAKGYVQFQEQFGMIVCWTDIYVCRNF